MVAVIDVETDSMDGNKANLKWFGGLDIETGEIFMCDYTNKTKIQTYIRKHKVLIGFNLKGFDLKVLERFGVDKKYKTIIDLYEIFAPKGDGGFGRNNKNRLHDINPSLKLENYKLKTILEVLELDEKGEIDYDIFKKDTWNTSEIKEIKKYLKQDLLIEKKLFDWYRNIFKPLEKYLSPKDVERFKYLNCSSGSLAYKFICAQTGREEIYNETDIAMKIKRLDPKIEGGHHIYPKHEKVSGNIIYRDFVSHYPTIIIMGQLHQKEVNDAIEKNLNERLNAKRKGNNVTALALKVPLNSMYGITGNPTFKNIYNFDCASNCTRIGRELLKKYAKTLDISGFTPLYGFTDGVYCAIPKGLTEDDLELVTQCFIDDTKKEFEKPIDSYNLDVDNKLKFMWFINKGCNNYLLVDDKNKVEIKGGLFNKNCPCCVKRLFEDYISPKIIKELDVNFSEDELFNELILLLKKSPELSAQTHSVKSIKDYPVKTSLQYQISEKYGNGKHLLIPNTANIGVGRVKKYCSIEEFKENKLTEFDIDTDRMMRYFLPFYTTKEKVVEL